MAKSFPRAPMHGDDDENPDQNRHDNQHNAQHPQAARAARGDIGVIKLAIRYVGMTRRLFNLRVNAASGIGRGIGRPVGHHPILTARSMPAKQLRTPRPCPADKLLTRMSAVTIDPPTQPFEAVVAIPGSKSLTNRALVMGALADGQSGLSNILLADDTRLMLDGLQRLGFDLSLDEAAATVSIRGQNG